MAAPTASLPAGMSNTLASKRYIAQLEDDTKKYKQQAAAAEAVAALAEERLKSALASKEEV